MRIVAAALVAVVCAAGCGGDKPDNSKIQSPADQPIGAPKALGASPGGNGPGNLPQGKGGQAHKIEVKQ